MDNTENAFEEKQNKKDIILATKSQRLIAYIIDNIIIVMIFLIFSFLFSGFYFNTIMTEKDLEKMNNKYEELYGDVYEENIYSNSLNNIKSIKLFTDDSKLVIFLLTLFVCNIILTILYYVLYASKNNGQTIGRKMMNIRIVKEINENEIKAVKFADLFYREIVIIFIISIPFNGLIFVISSLFAFRENQKALHDTLSKTIVIEK